ncbi:MFS transporter [Actinokineospora sp. 24-640]
MTAGSVVGALPRAGRREWLGLALLCLASLVVAVDVFVLLLALPHVSADLGADSVEQLWIMDIHGFFLGGFLITMGGLGDRIGRRRLLMIGAAAFAVAAVLSAFATSPEMLIGARALLGIAGATLGPSAVALISTMFPDPRQMGLAIGIWTGTFTVGAIIGPLVGGAMLETFWWGSVFLLAVPPMLLLLLLGRTLLPESEHRRSTPLDLVSVALSLAAILPFVYGVKEIAKFGWQAVPLAAMAVGIAVGVAFVARQRTITEPLLDLKLFRNPDFGIGLVSMLFISVFTAATMMLMTQSFQMVQGLTPFVAGLALLPGMAISTLSAIGSQLLARRYGPGYLIAGGLAIVVVGLLMVTQVEADSSPALLIAGFAVWCLGGGPLLSLGVNLIVGAAPVEKVGTAAAMPQISNELGSAMGFAILGSVGATVYRSSVEVGPDVPAEAAAVAGESLPGALTVAGSLPAETAGPLMESAREAFTSGMHTVAYISAVVMAGVAVLVLTKLRHVRPLGQQSKAGSDKAPLSSV